MSSWLVSAMIALAPWFCTRSVARMIATAGVLVESAMSPLNWTLRLAILSPAFASVIAWFTASPQLGDATLPVRSRTTASGMVATGPLVLLPQPDKANVKQRHQYAFIHSLLRKLVAVGRKT